MVAAWSTVVYGFSLSAIAGLDHDVVLEQSRVVSVEASCHSDRTTSMWAILFFFLWGVGQISSSSGNPGSIGTYLDRQSL